jgi:hypothetical protein
MLQRLDVRDYFRAVGVGIDLAVDLGDAARRIDDEGMAARHMDESQRPIGIITFGDCATVIGQQGERQPEFFGEAIVTRGAVQTDADQLHAQGVELGDVVAEMAGLLGAARGVVLGIEIHHQPFAGVIGELMELAVLILQRKWRRRLANHEGNRISA